MHYLTQISVTLTKVMAPYPQVMLELARLYLTLDEVDACQEQCSVILKNDQFNEDATLVCPVCLSSCLTITFLGTYL